MTADCGFAWAATLLLFARVRARRNQRCREPWAREGPSVLFRGDAGVVAGLVRSVILSEGNRAYNRHGGRGAADFLLAESSHRQRAAANLPNATDLVRATRLVRCRITLVAHARLAVLAACAVVAHTLLGPARTAELMGSTSCPVTGETRAAHRRGLNSIGCCATPDIRAQLAFRDATANPAVWAFRVNPAPQRAGAAPTVIPPCGVEVLLARACRTRA